MNGPPVISECGSHGGWAGRVGAGYGQRQAVMIRAEVIDGADQVHPVVQGGGASCQGTSLTRERGQPLAEGGIEAFNIGSVDHTVALREASELLDLCGRASKNAAHDTNHVSVGVVLDDLGNMDVFPGTQTGTTSLAGGERITKGFLN